MAHQGWDSLTIDLQHGLIDYQAMVQMLQAISTTDTVPVVRVPWLEPGILMKTLDAGAYGVICPMVNTREDAQKLVAWTHYQPRGTRSFGPVRALLCGGWEGGSRDVDSALLKNRLSSGERFVLVDEQGKPSRSRFTPVQRWADATLCEVDIYSGRMHQIRVHAAEIGHPVAGDRKYGQADDKRPLRELGLRRTFLHAFSMRLPAIGEFPQLTVESPLPEELEQFLQKLGPGR